MKMLARILTILTLALIPAIAEAQPRRVTVSTLGSCGAGNIGVERIAVDATGVTDCTIGGNTTTPWTPAHCACTHNGSAYIWAAQIASVSNLTSGAASSIDSQIALFSGTGGKTLKTAGAATIAANPAFVAGQVGVGTTGFIFEGSTADTIESLLTVADPASSDKTWTIPNATGTFVLSTLATNAPDAANSVTGASNALVFEGATADEFEISVSPADPGADATLTLPAETAAVMVSALTTNATDAANSVTGGSNKLVFEGATANDFETSLAPTDPTADRAITLPNAAGMVALYDAQPQTVTITAAAGGANVAEFTVTVKDGVAATVAAVHHLDVWLSDAASCAGLTSNVASGTVTAKAASGRDVVVYTAKKDLRVETLATGVFVLEVTDSAKVATIYVCAEVNGKAVAYDVQAADYGA